MTRFYFRIYQNGDPDGDNIWVDAMTESEARREVEHEYWGIDNLILLRTEKLVQGNIHSFLPMASALGYEIQPSALCFELFCSHNELFDWLIRGSGAVH